MHIPKNILFTAAALFICIFLYRGFPSINNMEARNIVTAREILQNDSWLIPTMNGEVRIAKPPLPTWVTALTIELAGSDADLSAIRIPAGLCALLIVFFVFLLSRMISPEQGFVLTGMLVLATSPIFMEAARRNTWDIYAHSAMAGAVWAMFEAITRKRGKAPFFLFSSFLMAFSFYSKGPVSFWTILLPFLLSYSLAYGVRDLWANRTGLLLSFGLCFILSASWPLYVYLSIPATALSIATRESSDWFVNHTQPLWYYPLHLYRVGGIWLFFLLYGIAAPFIRKDRTREEKMYAWWFLLTVVLLSMIPEKKFRYLLPAAIPGAVVITLAIYRLRERAGPVWKAMYGPFCLVIGMALFVAAGLLSYFSAGRVFCIAGALLMVLTGFAVIYTFIAAKTKHSHFLTTAGICLCIVFLTPLDQEHNQKDVNMQFLQLRSYPELKQRQMFYSGNVPIELVWAAGKKIRPLNESDLSGFFSGKGSNALITEGKLAHEPPGTRLAYSVRDEHTEYYIYLVN